MAVLGVAAMLAGSDKLLLVGGAVLVAVGIGLTVYYMGFGVFYDSESFLVMSAGKKRREYRFSQIQAQQLYRNGSNIIIELFLADGTAVQLQSSMTGVYLFLDTAFAAWCQQKGLEPEDCEFHDPDNSCWFPPVEG